ncbi:hypothetical protein Tco_0611055 [Tanacetum coccineum]
MLKKFGLKDFKPMKTPMSSDAKLTKDEECESVDSTKYRGMIGSLLYLTASRPDIMFSVCLCARFQKAPKTSHLEAVKVTMPQKSSEDYKNTRHYIPKISHEFRTPIREKLMNLEERYIHEGQLRRIRHEEEIDVLEYQILTREIVSTLKPLEEIIRENVFCLGGNQDHVSACLCFMLYCVIHSERFNLAYYMAKRIEWVTKQDRTDLHNDFGLISTKIENAFKIRIEERFVKHNSCSEKEDNNSETASSKSAKECSLNSETQDVHAIKYKMSKSKERCMAYFRSLHSHLQVLSKED